MLDQGRIVIDGTPDEVQATDNAWVKRFLGIRTISSGTPGLRTRMSQRRPAEGSPTPPGVVIEPTPPSATPEAAP